MNVESNIVMCSTREISVELKRFCSIVFICFYRNATGSRAHPTLRELYQFMYVCVCVSVQCRNQYNDDIYQGH